MNFASLKSAASGLATNIQQKAKEAAHEAGHLAESERPSPCCRAFSHSHAPHICSSALPVCRLLMPDASRPPVPATTEAREAAAGAMNDRTDEEDTLPELR